MAAADQPPRGTYPIVLAHGICRFDVLTNRVFDMDNSEDDRFHYFRRVRTTLEAAGYVAFHANVSWAAGVETRAAELREDLLRITQGFTLWPRVHIIAHSMGGLDARHMILRYRMEGRVASLSTISTPHLGTSFADWGLARLGGAIPLLARLGLDATGFRDLTRESCEAFNRETEAFELANGVRYRTYAGVEEEDRVLPLLRFPWRIIHAREGENDGLVPLSSARWRDEFFQRTIRADHLNETGWWNPRDLTSEHAVQKFERHILDFYLDIADGL